MIQPNPNLDSEIVKDDSIEAPAMEYETTADGIPQLPRHLHPAIKAIVEPFPADRREVMALMSLPFLGMMGGNAKFLYRNQEEHYLGFECCIMDAQSNGKSALTRLQKALISEVIKEDDEIRAKNDEYADECNAIGEGERKPTDPHYGTRIMMGDTTKAQFFQNLKNLKGKRAIIICPEIDSLKVPNNWSRDGGANERLMFDTEIGGQDTKSTAGTSARVPVAVNLATSGTPLAVKNHYKNAEDGLVTRVGFCTFPQDMDEDAEEKPRTPENLAMLKQIQTTLLAEPVGDVIEIPALKRQMLKWCKDKKMIADASGNDSISTLRKRAAVMGFRAGCVLFLLDGKVLTRKALAFALWVSEYVLHFQLKYFGEKMNESIEANAEILQAPVQTSCRSLWAFVKLPDTFSSDQVKTLYQNMGKKASGYRSVISRWINRGWIERIENGLFRKTEAGLALGKS